MPNYVFLGPPGAGKGTLGELFCERNGLVHVSTGQLLRDEKAAGTELGLRIKELLAAGSLVPDEIVTAMVAKRIAQNDIEKHGCLLDGYPRTVPQADSLKQIFADNHSSLTAAVLIDADREMLMTRLTARRMCSNKECGAIYNLQTHKPLKEGICDRCGSALFQRDDDSEKTASERLRVYDQQTAPLIEYYRKEGLLVVTVSKDAPVDENYSNMLKALNL
jgi:adenylate kinase